VPAQPTKTILVVEGNAIVREGTAVVLFRHGYHALTASDGRQAWDILNGVAVPDLILLDMLLPVVDGWKLLDRLKVGRFKSMPVIIITGTILTPEWATEHGACGFLKKPVAEAELLAVVRRCLNQTRGAPDSALGE
jgi:CheY-like chemotaxis protein